MFVSSVLQIFSFPSTWVECRRITHSWTQTLSSLYFGVCTRSTDALRWRSTICQRTAWVDRGVLCLHMDSTSCAVAELMRSLEKHCFLSENLLSVTRFISPQFFVTLTRAHDRARSSTIRIKFKVKYALEQPTKAQRGNRGKYLLFL